MESIKYLLTRFSRVNNLNRDEFPYAFGFFDYPTGNASAKATVGYKKAAFRYGGSAVVDYNRLDLAKLFLNIAPEVTLYQPRNHRVVFKELLRVYGLPGAEEDDFVNECTDTALDPAAPPSEVTLTMSATSRLYKGQIKVKVKPKIMPLDEVVVIRDLDLLVNRFSLNNTKLVLERKYYHYDFTFSPQIASLRAIRPGQYAHGADTWYTRMLNDADLRAEALPAVNWIWEGWGGQQPYNVYLSTCLYNGPTRDYPDACTRYNYVAVFSCPGTGDKQNTVGNFMFHYD